MFRGCKNCNKGYIYFYENDDLCVKKCDCFTTYHNKKELKYNIIDSNIPKDFINYKISSYKGNKSVNNLEIIAYFINNFEKEYADYNMYFYGKQGTQKTTIAKYIVVQLLKQNKSCYYVLADTLIKLLLEANRNEESKEQLRIIANKDFLVLDEMSDDKCTIYKSEYQIPFLTSFLKVRLEQFKKSTIFISNYSIDKLYESKFGKTIADLLNRECYEKLLFEDIYFSLTKSEIKTIANKIKNTIQGK